MGGHFIDVSRPVQTRIDTCTSQSLLLHECCTNSEVAKMRTLIDHGANIDARDQNGYTSLQYLVTQIRRVPNSSERDFESLIHLIKSGADIHSRNNAGQSIWDAAMNNRRKGSYARDMWDFALVYCGYISEMEAFTRDNPRHAVYWEGRYDEYLRADFEEIWEGWEHLCPYYGDEESGLDCASFILGTQLPSTPSSTCYSTSTTSSMRTTDNRDIDQTPPNQQQDSIKDESSVVGLLEETIDHLTQESDREAHCRVDNSCYEELRLTEGRVASLGTSHLDESVKTWLSKSSVSSDMSDSSSVASLQDLHNTEVGFSEEVYENPWAEG